MKKLILIALPILSFFCKGQTPVSQVNVPAPAPRMQTYNWVSRPEEDGTDLQKKFVKQEWTPGVVKFRSGRPAMEVPLLFDVLSDKLYYLTGDLIMEFVDSVSQFSVNVPYKGDTITMLYRRFYPPVQANSSATFYQLLVDGKISLMKCQAKSIFLFKDPAMPEERKKDPPKQLYFAFLPGKKIVQVDLDPEKISVAMPEYSNLIYDIIKKEKLKPKDEERLSLLFIHLNNALK